MFYARKTENKSFIDMWRELQRCDVSNNIFPLNTKNKILKDYKKDDILNLDPETQRQDIITKLKLITNESRTNIWFYFREILFIHDETSVAENDLIHFPINKKILYMLYLYENNISFILKDPNELEILALKLLWNYQRSMYGNELCFVYDDKEVELLTLEINKIINNLPIKVMTGSSQTIDVGNNHCFLVNKDIFHYDIKSMIDHRINSITPKDTTPVLFSFDNKDSVGYRFYSNILSYLKSSKIYGVIKDSYKSYEGQVFENTAKAFIPEIDESIFDTNLNLLNNIYFI